MPGPIELIVHPSQFPDAVQKELLRSLRLRAINHKFHYDSYKQAQKWLAVHNTFSPARTDPDCARIYDHAFRAAASDCAGKRVHLIGLGCGGAQKEVRLLELLAQSGCSLGFTPMDVSAAMVLVAASAARAIVNPSPGMVADLNLATDLSQLLSSQTPPDAVRVFTFFGMVPNFEPDVVLPKLGELVQHGDVLLFSANLAPGTDYRRGVEQILPLYENELTNDWLMTFLIEFGVERHDGELNWTIEGEHVLRLAAYFKFTRERSLSVHGEQFSFEPSEQIRLFFSYRYTPDTISELLSRYGLVVRQQWITDSGEEAVFLCGRR